MTTQQVNEILLSTGLPVTYSHWPEGAAPPLPYIAYYAANPENYPADGVVYYAARKYRVELYQELYNEEIQKKVADALKTAGIFWTGENIWIDDEKCYLDTYEFEV